MTINYGHQREPATITRSLVLDSVLDVNDDDDTELSQSPESLRISQSGHSEKEAHEVNDSLVTDASLGEIRNWLNLQCEKEQARTDWIPEYKPRTDKWGNAQRLGLDTTVLDRIRRGHGPRSARFEDILWPLRINPSSTDTQFSRRPRTESYASMLAVLQQWNVHVASPHDDPEARQALIDAMYNRITFLDRTLSHRRSADAHDDTSRKLLHAIHAYRPETASFKTKDTCHLLTIILAHIGFAIPHIDQSHKFLIFYTLVTERNSMAHTANADARLRLENRMAVAKRHNDADALAKYERKLRDWGKEIFSNNCAIVIQRIKTARLNIRPIVLAELQDLTVMQAAQKVVLADLLSRNPTLRSSLLPPSAALPAHLSRLSSSTSTLHFLLSTHLDPLFLSTQFATASLSSMKSTTSSRILTRAYKFSGRDVPHDQRSHVVRERMAHPGTARMMGDALEGVGEVRGKVGEVLDVLGGMEGWLEEIVKECEEVNREVEEVESLVGSLEGL